MPFDNFSNDPIIVRIRSGTTEDPYTYIEEGILVVNNFAELLEMPSENVVVEDSTGKQYNRNRDSSSSLGEFDYWVGDSYIKFNPSANGKLLTFKYYGRGIKYFPASRVYVRDITQNLRDMIESGSLGGGGGGNGGGGGGSVNSVTSANSDIVIVNNTTNPILALNSGLNAGQIVKLIADGKLPPSVIPDDLETVTGSQDKVNTHESNSIIHVTQADKDYWNSLEDSGNILILGETSTTAYRGDRGKIAYDHSQIAHAPANANFYVHPSNHPASMITQDLNNRFVTDVEKATWNAKSNLALGETNSTAYRGDRGKIAYDHTLIAHAPSNAQKNSDILKAEIEAKLTGLITSHTHPVSDGGGALTEHALTHITGGTDIIPNAIANGNSGLFSGTDKAKLDGISLNANNYIHPTGAGNNHIPTGGATGDYLRYSSSGVAVWSTPSDATTIVSGYMSANDKVKLDGIAINANNYVHPANHPASIITQNASNRFVTDAEKTIWNTVTSKVPKSGNTITELIKAQNNTLYSTGQIRNIIISPDDPTSGVGSNGDIYFKYKTI